MFCFPIATDIGDQMFQRKSQGIGAGLGFFRAARCPLLLISLVSGLLINSPLHAATFTVDSTVDAVDTAPGNGTCATSAGICTLRAAIQEANALPGADTITLPAGIYTLTLAGKNENAAASGDLDVTGADDLTITGAGATITRIAQQGTGSVLVSPDRDTVDRVFHFIGRNNVTIDGVTIEKGYAYATSGGNSLGGGIYNAGAFVTLKNCEVSRNIAEWASDTASDSMGTGGGIYNAANTKMTIENCTVGNNTVEIPSTSSGSNFRDGGGGIYNIGEMTIRNSLVEINSTIRYGSGILNSGTLTIVASVLRDNKDSTPFTPGQSSSRGGAIANIGGRLTLRDSSVTGNVASQGGGVYNDGIAQAGVVIIVSSDISGNTAQLWGGGIDNFSTMSILYSSITGNQVGSASFILIGDGGGIHNSGNSTLTVKHTTLSGNRAFRAGGGLFNGSRAELTHVTLSNNRAATGVTASADNLRYTLGNEVFIDPDVSQNDATVFQNSIIAGVVTPATSVGNCFSGRFSGSIATASQFEKPEPFTTTSKGYNIDNGNTCKLVLANNDLLDANPSLGPLADLGSTAGGVLITLPVVGTLPRWAHVPATGPAVNAIPTGACPSPGVDQRLHARPNVANGQCDIGAVEINSTPVAITDLQIILTESVATGRALRAVTADPVNYTITVTNNGPGDASGVSIKQTLDEGAVMLRSNSPQGAVCEQAGRTVTCRYDKVLRKDEIIIVYVAVTPPSGSRTLNSTAVVSTASTAAVVDFVPDNNSSTLTSTVSAALDPISTGTTPAASGGGGGGAFGMLPLAVLGMFGVLLAYRRRVSCHSILQ